MGVGKFLKYNQLLVLIKKLILRHNAIEAWDKMLRTGHGDGAHHQSDNADLTPRIAQDRGVSGVISAQWSLEKPLDGKP